MAQAVTPHAEALARLAVEETGYGVVADKIQKNLFERAKAYRDRWTGEVGSYDEFKKKIEDGGFLLAHWDGTRETEDRIQSETKATIRCIPFDRKAEAGKCMVTGRPSEGRVVFARAY